MIGRLLGNRYQILEKLGSGGMAVVYKARCTLLNRIVTVKVLRDEYTSDADFVRRFRQEAQAVASLSHPNIVSVYDVGDEDGIYYIVMEYIGGQNLKELIRERAPLPPAEAAEIARQIAGALEHAHENNIVHRDIKPHNILITNNGRVKVTDFGIARAVTAATVTRTGTIMGSVHYFSPEQARGEITGARSDIYSLGVVLYEMLTGRVPFEAESPIGVALKHVQAEPTPVTEVNPSVPAPLGRVVQRAMAKNPDFRYETAGDLIRDLRTYFPGRTRRTEADDDSPTQLLTGLDTADIRADSPGDRDRKPKRRLRPVGWVLLSLLFLGLLGGSYYAFAPILFPGETTVPNVVGMTEEQALQELKKYNLNMDVKERKESNDVKKGLVMEQDPEAKESVRQGRAIEVKVSAGPRLVKVPNVVTYGLREAETMLQNNEFEPLFDPEADYEYDEKISKDIVIRQDPGAGEMKPRGIQVRLTVSKGPEPKQIFMPDLRTKPLADAKKEITAANLAEGPVTEEASGEYAPGQVIRQTPEANTPVLEGSEVALVVSNGPGPPTQTARVWVDVPDDGSDHVVRVMVLDSRGTTQVYLETHPPGDRVRLDDVRFLGKGKIQVYVDDVLREQKLVPE